MPRKRPRSDNSSWPQIIVTDSPGAKITINIAPKSEPKGNPIVSRMRKTAKTMGALRAAVIAIFVAIFWGKP